MGAVNGRNGNGASAAVGSASETVIADAIAICGISASGRHGVTERERSAPQPLLIDIELRADLWVPARSDELADTINYSALHKKVIEIVETQTFKLLERLADAIIDEIFADERVIDARVRISKPCRLKGATPSVTIGRRRERGVQEHR